MAHIIWGLIHAKHAQNWSVHRERITVIGWGFSYQARDTRSNDYVCDFKFKSFTFNAGETINSDINPGFQVFTDSGTEDGKKNLVHDKLQNFIRLAGEFLINCIYINFNTKSSTFTVNYWRENVKNPRYKQNDYRERLLRVSKINEWGKEHKWDNLMKCNYDNVKPTSRVTTTTQSSPSPPRSSTPAAATAAASTQATTQASKQATTKATSPRTTTTSTRATPAATPASCEVTLVPKDSEGYLKSVLIFKCDISVTSLENSYLHCNSKQKISSKDWNVTMERWIANQPKDLVDMQIYTK